MSLAPLACCRLVIATSQLAVGYSQQLLHQPTSGVAHLVHSKERSGECAALWTAGPQLARVETGTPRAIKQHGYIREP